MGENEQVISEFYQAFQRHDGAAMAALYHGEAKFSDPVFPDLDGAGAGAMWEMLTAGGGDLRVEFKDVQADGEEGSARWEAWYTFPATKREVHNVIEARFEFREGKIIRHVDDFDFWRWSRQALGPVGVILGWTPFLKKKVQAQAARGLARWRAKRGPADE